MTLTDDMALRLFFLPVMAGSIAYQVYCADERDRITVLDNKQPRYQPFYWLTKLLPFIMAFYVVRELLWPSSRCPLQKSVFSCAVVFLSATLYDSVLLLLLPWLRRRINARTCGILWTMPGFLYLTLYSWFQLDRPALILRPPVRLLSLFLPVWMTGSVLVLLWAVIQHLRFRRAVLRESVPEQNPEILSLWHEEQALAGFQERPFSWSVPLLSAHRSLLACCEKQLGWYSRSGTTIMRSCIWFSAMKLSTSAARTLGSSCF